MAGFYESRCADNPFSTKFSKLLPMVLLLFSVLSVSAGTSDSFKSRYVKTKEGRRACIEGSIFLRVPCPQKNCSSFAAKKYLGDIKKSGALLKYNPSLKRKRLSEVRIALADLLPVYRIETISALFPEDKRVEKGWQHKVGNETVGQLARWFCGSTKKSGELLKTLGKKQLKQGESVVIPEHLLIKAFSAIPPAETAKKPDTPQTKTEDQPEMGQPVKASLPEISTEEARKLLTYGNDDKGQYALYHLAQKEALYSAVVVRFTGRLFASEVNALAMGVAERSEIKDVTSIPVGYPVKIPLDFLLPQFHPEDSALYKNWLTHQQDLSGIINSYKNSSLEGVVVILDPGHGGLDRGAIKNGVFEDSYVYDIVCRIREGLETKTRAKVYVTLMEPTKGFKPIDKPGLTPNRKATLLTHPPFTPDSSSETKAAVNLRWVLSNHHFVTLKKSGVDSDKIIFTSVHADSLHPSLRGSMFYVPGSLYRQTSWGVKGQFFAPFSETKTSKSLSMNKKELERSEGLSVQFAKKLEASFKKNGLKMHPYSPTRDHVVRSKKSD